MKLIRIKEVMEITGMSRTSIYDMSHDGRFPKFVRLSQRSSAWIHEEVLLWVESKIAERNKNIRAK